MKKHKCKPDPKRGSVHGTRDGAKQVSHCVECGKQMEQHHGKSGKVLKVWHHAARGVVR